jgi:DNA-binding response OmpR family regulator
MGRTSAAKVGLRLLDTRGLDAASCGEIPSSSERWDCLEIPQALDSRSPQEDHRKKPRRHKITATSTTVPTIPGLPHAKGGFSREHCTPGYHARSLPRSQTVVCFSDIWVTPGGRRQKGVYSYLVVIKQDTSLCQLAQELPSTRLRCFPSELWKPQAKGNSRNLDLEEGESTMTTPNGKQLTVLVIDDSSVSRKVLELRLSHKQYSLIFATTGHEAIELFEKHRPALVIMDWMLPDLTGEELCSRIRVSSQNSYTYIIALTSRTDNAGVVSALEAGADDHLTKPFDRGELVARVAVGVRTVELHRQLEFKSALLEKLALTDALTGLPNRRAIENWAATQLSGAARHEFSYWVVQVDLDHFKQVNDTFGHDAGDEVKNF